MTEDAARPVVPPGQEGLLRKMLQPTDLPADWAFTSAKVTGSAIHAYYRHIPGNVAARMVLAHPSTQVTPQAGTRVTDRFILTLRATQPHATLPALLDAVEASVRSLEAYFQWTVVTPVPSHEPTGASPVEDLHEIPLDILYAGLDAVDAGDLPAGLAAAAHALAVPPGGPRALAASARLQFGAGEPEGALTLLADALTDPATDTATASLFRATWADLALRHGRLTEVHAVVTDALRQPHAAADVRLQELAATLDRVFHNTASARAHLEAALAVTPEAVHLWMKYASALAALDHRTEARDAVTHALTLCAQGSPEEVPLRLDAAAQYLHAGAYSDAEGALAWAAAHAPPPHAAKAHATRGRLRAWAGDTVRALDAARDALAADPTCAAARTVRGIALALTGDPAAARAELDAALQDDPQDAEARVWRAEILLRGGDPARALAEIDHAGGAVEDLGDYIAGQLVRSLALFALDRFPGMPEYVLPDALKALCPTEAAAASADNAQLPAALDSALKALRGCRSPTPAYVPPGGGALVPLRVQPSPRTPCKHALWRFMYTGDATGTEAALQAVAAAWPLAPEPHCYRGELYLYLGDYPTARACFDEALALNERTRWAYIGLAAVDLLHTGDPAAALARLAHGARVVGGEGPTAWIYRGEALLRQGDLPAARTVLERAVTMNPQRVGAWIDLALVHLAAGDHAALGPVLTHLADHAPGLLADATAAAGVPAWTAAARAAVHGGVPEPVVAVLETALRMMRGNRSSTSVTYFTSGGVLRAVPPEGGVAAAAAVRAALRAELDEVAAAGAGRMPTA